MIEKQLHYSLYIVIMFTCKLTSTRSPVAHSTPVPLLPVALSDPISPTVLLPNTSVLVVPMPRSSLPSSSSVVDKSQIWFIIIEASIVHLIITLYINVMLMVIQLFATLTLSFNWQIFLFKGRLLSCFYFSSLIFPSNPSSD